MSDFVDEGFIKNSDSNLVKVMNDRHDFNAHFNQAKLTDLNARRHLRYWVSTAVFIILVGQLILLGMFLNIAFQQNTIQNLQWLFISLFGGIFAEIYLLAKLIVMWLFKDLPYKPD
jgi:uncharacterized Tic20 family protein